MTRGAPLLALSLLAACSGTCGDAELLAELSARVGGDVERDEAATQDKWHDADLGTRFTVGDGLRTGPESSAELDLLPSGSAHVAPHSIVRFMATPPRDDNRHVALEAGEVVILAEQIDLDIHTPRAVAQVSRGSKLKLSMRDGHERFDLVVGRVVVAHAGVTRSLEPAQPLELNAANELVSIAPSPPDAGAKPSDPALAASTPTLDLPLGDSGAHAQIASAGLNEAGSPAVPEDAGKRPSAQPLSPSALRMRAIESATLHVSAPPVDVLLPAGECGAGAQLRVDGQALAVADEAASTQLAAGNHRIQLVCTDGTRRDARVVVKRDPARLELPKRAQSVRVEADGRRYTVRYQNLLPDLTFVWPGEAEEGPFTLLVRSGKRELTRALETPEHVLSGAQLGEGEHKFWFRDGSGRSSKPTTLRLAFDNTARSAYLSLPLEGSSVSEGAVPVEGAALVASKVSVEGIAARLDPQGRFHEQVQLAPQQKAVSVRVEHPGSGVHYYLRRLR